MAKKLLLLLFVASSVAFSQDLKLSALTVNPELSEGADSPVVWDYHVIFITFEKGSSEGWVIDQDSRLGFPARLSEYISASFKPGLDLGSEFIQ